MLYPLQDPHVLSLYHHRHLSSITTAAVYRVPPPLVVVHNGKIMALIEKCMGDSKADADNSILKEEHIKLHYAMLFFSLSVSKLVFLAQLYIATLIRTLSVDKNVKFSPLLKYVLLLAGKLEKGVVLRAICAGFEEATEPTACLSGEHIQDPLVGVGTFTEYGGTLWRCVCFEHKFMSEYFSTAAVETNECLDNSGGCWQDK
ncbi:hypothetical protein Pint_10161 [Pistacia integerrima]|uniref:Uncharacterized protein n=1 Tax=Pistacia integerrima TaxID=434235 RepID=A0ACC0XKF4_9ROSI|nr:hypothetical protein Pint_10161 [Pistacia integerrima]